MNEKEKYHFEILKQSVLGNQNAFDKIALAFDFDESQIDTLCSVFEEFEQKEFRYSELEQRLKETLGLDYQDLQSVIHYLYEDHRYTDVISSYLRSNRDIMGSLSIEYNSIAKELGI